MTKWRDRAEALRCSIALLHHSTGNIKAKQVDTISEFLQDIVKIEKSNATMLLYARIRDLEKALRPFAEASKLFSHRHVSINPKDLFLWCQSSTTHGNRGITVADVDNAKRVLEGK